jgi:CRISPR-associated helicase Cas3/CRISPR-associated endonuclease Cas3-HD
VAPQDLWGWLWGKARRSGDGWHPLAAHVLETAQVALLLWQHWLPRNLRVSLSDSTSGDGRLIAALAGLHDLGKASPAFQVAVPSRLPDLERAGFTIDHADAIRGLRQRAPHGLVSGCALRSWLLRRGVEPAWATVLAEIVAGHHGVFPLPPWTHKEEEYPDLFGIGEWKATRAAIVDSTLAHLDVSASELAELRLDQPARLVLAGLVTMADWIASMESAFPYASRPGDSASDAAARAEQAWRRLRLGSPWRPVPPPNDLTLFVERFGWAPRLVQTVAAGLAREADGPRLLIIEAPMGEGKTEAALAAAELFAATTGAGGVFIGLPTQATSNQMFSRVRRWLERQPGQHTLHLVHGAASRHAEFRQLLEATPKGVGDDGDDQTNVEACAWFSGHKRGLLAPFAVGTVDQVLMAALRARHVSLRHLGLAGKVVVIDEVHAYDAYMSVFLVAALRWLGAHSVPVVLLSATLPPAVRRRLIGAYTGTTSPAEPVPTYPQVSVAAIGGQPHSVPVADTAVRRTLLVRQLQTIRPDDADLTRLLVWALLDGGAALVVCNTVRRAQETYRHLRRTFPDEVSLLHARFCHGERRKLEEQLVIRFGPAGRRPHRSVVVATQVAEQSLDIDFDLVVSDLAPVDLVLQRVGRLHRHDIGERPAPLRDPTLVLTGWVDHLGAVPEFAGGSRKVYGDHLLLRSAAVLRELKVIRLPADVPVLVDAVYSDYPVSVPGSWTTGMAAAQAEQQRLLLSKQASASQFVVPDPSARADATLDGMTRFNVGEAVADDDPVAVGQVRDAPPSL